ETAEVKYAIDRFTARCLPQPVALERIRIAASRAVERVGDMPPYVMEAPIALEMTMGDASMAAAIARIPWAERSGDRSGRYSAPDALTAMNVCRIGLVLAGAIARNERL